MRRQLGLEMTGAAREERRGDRSTVYDFTNIRIHTYGFISIGLSTCLFIKLDML